MRTTRSYKKSLAACPPFRFLSLPVELSLQIYSYLLAPNGDPDLSNRFFNHEPPFMGKDTDESTAFALTSWVASEQTTVETKEIFLQILSVCKAIHDEAYPIFYHNHLFRFRGDLNHPSGCLTFETEFFNRLEPNKAMQLRHIEMEVNFDGGDWRKRPRGFRSSRFNSVPRLLGFLERNKAKLNLHSCTLTTGKTKWTVPPLPLAGSSNYAAQIHQLWNVDNSDEKSIWEGVLKICEEIFPEMNASREVKDGAEKTIHYFRRTYKAVASKS